jgi:hypothetical protein
LDVGMVDVDLPLKPLVGKTLPVEPPDDRDP